MPLIEDLSRYGIKDCFYSPEAQKSNAYSEVKLFITHSPKRVFVKVEPRRVRFFPRIFTTFLHMTFQITPPSVLVYSQMTRQRSPRVSNSITLLKLCNTTSTYLRIAINVEKSQAIVFRKWGVINPQAELTLFDDNIHWVPVVRYLGLHIDSRLTYKKHIDYLSDKFWGRIALAISLIRRSSPLSLENKVILYKRSPVWGAAAPTHTKRIQVIQNKILRIIANAPWYVRNSVLHHDLHMEPIDNYITRTSRNVFTSIQNHDNPVIRAQTLFTYPHSKLNFAYKTTKWNLPLKPP
ncbi:RNA-directed DNA polymerase from mobile element jockey [Trichonephila clavipes]|nr:RNA-directed DNA polymerase from mobile element jockey [Trichonephila clavipes]